MSAFTYTSFGYCDLVFIWKYVESERCSTGLFIPSLSQSLLITAPSALGNSLVFICFPLSFKRNLKSLSSPFFSAEIFYIFYIYMLYIYMSGYLVLVFFPLKPWNSTREIF